MKRYNMEKLKLFIKAYNRFRIIENENDLSKQGISLNDYNSIRELLIELSYIENVNQVETLAESVKEWFGKLGFKTSPAENGINYIISFS